MNMEGNGSGLILGTIPEFAQGTEENNENPLLSIQLVSGPRDLNAVLPKYEAGMLTIRP
jgi:hypothetical protein